MIRRDLAFVLALVPPLLVGCGRTSPPTASAEPLPKAVEGKAAPAPVPTPVPRTGGVFRMTVFALELHGLAVALELPSGAVCLVDTGRKHHGQDAGKDTLAPFLKKRGVKELAAVVISHPHHDHYEGAASLLKHFGVKRWIDAGPEGPPVPEEYATLRASAVERGVPLSVVRAGDVLRWDDSLEVEVLAPPRGGVASTDEEALNDNSIVLRIQHGKNVFLLPGDIVKDGRDSLLASVPVDRLRSTVLVAPHHGFFEGHRFVQAVRPRVVVVSCQDEYPDKKIRSPGQHVTDQFGPAGAQVYVTAWDGTVEVESDGNDVTVRTERARK